MCENWRLNSVWTRVIILHAFLNEYVILVSVKILKKHNEIKDFDQSTDLEIWIYKYEENNCGEYIYTHEIKC